MFALVNEVFCRWIESVSELTANLLGRFVSPTTIRLIEDEHGEFVVQRPEAVRGVEFAVPGFDCSKEIRVKASLQDHWRP